MVEAGEDVDPGRHYVLTKPRLYCYRSNDGYSCRWTCCPTFQRALQSVLLPACPGEDIEKDLSTSEAIPLPEHVFRYDRGGFRVGAASFSYFTGIPFNNFARRWLDDFLHNVTC
jgi:hypothetical protein